jgi:hypothetical protein
MSIFEIYDNIVPEFYQEILKKEIFSPNFPWYYNPTNVPANENAVAEPGIDYPDQFTHPVIWENMSPDREAFNIINPILLFFQKETGTTINNIARIKLNLLNQHPYPPTNPAHTDNTNTDVKTLLYYVNDSDGDTVLYNQVWGDDLPLTECKRITPKQGRLILFNATRWHASTNPVNTKARSIININFI